MLFKSVFPGGGNFVLEVAKVDSFTVADDGECALGERYFVEWIAETDWMNVLF